MTIAELELAKDKAFLIVMEAEQKIRTQKVLYENAQKSLNVAQAQCDVAILNLLKARIEIGDKDDSKKKEKES